MDKKISSQSNSKPLPVTPFVSRMPRGGQITRILRGKVRTVLGKETIISLWLEDKNEIVVMVHTANLVVRKIELEHGILDYLIIKRRDGSLVIILRPVKRRKVSKVAIARLWRELLKKLPKDEW